MLSFEDFFTDWYHGGGTTASLRLLEAESKQNAFVMAGIPGAGKTTFVDEALKAELFPRDAHILNPDMTMVLMPEYKKDCARYGQDAAYNNWELPAREKAYSDFDAALLAQKNIIIDMGCARQENIDMIMRLENQNYTISIFYMCCDINVAFERARHRDRPMPLARIQKRAEAISRFVSVYQDIATPRYFQINNG